MGKNIKNQKKWSSRDWIWLVGILIVINIILVANVYDYVHIEANFSIISSAVSIALALVAIFIALKQDSDNQQVNNQISYLLNEISTNVRNVDAKLDPKVLSSVGEETADVYSLKIEEQPSYTKEEVDKIINNVSKDITSSISDILNPKNNKDNYDQTYWNKKMRNKSLEKTRITNIITNNKNKNLEELQDIIVKETGTVYSLATISKYRRDVFNSYAG